MTDDLDTDDHDRPAPATPTSRPRDAAPAPRRSCRRRRRRCAGRPVPVGRSRSGAGRAGRPGRRPGVVGASFTGRARQRRRPRLRPDRHDHLRRGPPRPAGRPARSARRRSCRSSRASPTRPRIETQARRGPRPARRRRRRTATRPTPRTSSRGSTARWPSASARCPTRSSCPVADRVGDGPRPAPSSSSRSRTRPAARPGSTSLIAESGATTSTEAVRRRHPHAVCRRRRSRRAPTRVLDGKVAVVGDVASVKAAVDTQGRRRPSPAEPSLKAALDATDRRPHRVRLHRHAPPCSTGRARRRRPADRPPRRSWASARARSRGMRPRLGRRRAARRGRRARHGVRSTRQTRRPSARARTAPSTVADHVPASADRPVGQPRLRQDAHRDPRHCTASEPSHQAG